MSWFRADMSWFRADMSWFRRDRAERHAARADGWLETLLAKGARLEPADQMTLLYPNSPAAWLNLARVHADDGDLEAALPAYSRAFELSRGSPRVADYAIDLAAVLFVRQGRGGAITDLERATEILALALADPAVGKGRSAVLAMQCRVWSSLANRTEESHHLDRGLTAGRRAVETARTRDDRIEAREQLGQALIVEHHFRRDPGLLAEAVELFEQALHLARREEAEDRAILRHRLTEACLRLYRANRDLAVLHRAVELARTGVTDAQDDFIERGGALLNLGCALRERHAVSGGPEDLDEGTAALRSAMETAASDNPGAAVSAADELGDWSLERRSWREAAEAFSVKLSLLRRMLEAQEAPANRRLMLSVDIRLASKAAYAWAEAGQPEKALLVLEEWRTVLTDPQLPKLDELLAASRDTPAVFLATCAPSGFAVIVREGRATYLPLPDLASEPVIGWAERLLRAKQERGTDRDTWERMLDWVGEWLWSSAMGPVLAELGARPRIALVACGPLSVLPLHAAWRPEASGPTGRRYAMDDTLIVYAPSLRALRRAQRRARWVSDDVLLTVEDPADPGVADPHLLQLPFAETEGEAAGAFWARKARLARDRATKEAVLTVLARANVVHFACHAIPQGWDGGNAGLVLAHGETLTLDDIYSLALKIRLAVLSACDTATPQEQFPDESAGLASAFVRAGAAGAVASQWPLPDRDAMMIMTMFYGYWRADGLPPAEALRRAQQWVRDTTNGEKSAYFAAHLDASDRFSPAVATACWEQVVLADPGERTMAAPIFWAAFTFTGA
ncbi:CHAT domain-containing protein [Streptomyces sp. NPDC021093]|uniref:CHAT domain-containing protein n=1 Tax=Streptomyces sp. NPDC021093 TaxID=3365112 RepID=UPI0037A48A26